MLPAACQVPPVSVPPEKLVKPYTVIVPPPSAAMIPLFSIVPPGPNSVPPRKPVPPCTVMPAAIVSVLPGLTSSALELSSVVKSTSPVPARVCEPEKISSPPGILMWPCWRVNPPVTVGPGTTPPVMSSSVPARVTPFKTLALLWPISSALPEVVIVPPSIAPYAARTHEPVVSVKASVASLVRVPVMLTVPGAPLIVPRVLLLNEPPRLSVPPSCSFIVPVLDQVPAVLSVPPLSTCSVP